MARLATADLDGRPHLVPITFALAGDTLVTAIDHKPKSTMNLRRLRNIQANPQVSVLVDHYDDDWTALWWVRVDGLAEIRARDEDALDLLADKYAQYRDHRPDGPVIAISITRWTAWSH